MNKVSDLAAWLDGDDQGKRMVAFVQLLTALSATLFVIDPVRGQIYGTIFIVTMGLVVFAALFVMAFYRRYDLNVLYLQKDNGCLYDKNLKIPNVALRRKTMDAIIAELEQAAGEDALEKLGCAIGADFAEAFKNMRLLEKEGLTSEELLKKILDYDASSGMGKFNLISFCVGDGARIEIRVVNPFTKSKLANRLSPFLVGYLGGVVREICNLNVTAETSEKEVYGANDAYNVIFVRPSLVQN